MAGGNISSRRKITSISLVYNSYALTRPIDFGPITRVSAYWSAHSGGLASDPVIRMVDMVLAGRALLHVESTFMAARCGDR